MIGFLESNKEIIETICSIIGAIGSIAIPVMLALWIKGNEDKRYEEQLLKDEREFIQKFIDTRLKLPYLSEIKTYILEKRKDFFDDIGVELTRLRLVILSTKYDYLSNYIDKIVSIIEKYNNEDDFPAYYSFTISGIHMITRYMNIGEEEFDKVWEEDLETIEEILEKRIESIKNN